MKVAVIRLSSLGDIVLTEPLVRILKKDWNAEIHFFTKEQYCELLEYFNDVSEVHIFNGKIKTLKKFKELDFDLVVDLHSKLSTFIIKKYLKGTHKVAYSKKSFLRRLIVKKWTEKNINSTLDLYLNTISKIKLLYPDFQNRENIFQVKPVLHTITKKKLDYKKKILDTLNRFNIPSGKSLIGIFPGALHKTKMYPIDQMIDFINMVPNSWDCKFILMGSKKEKLQCAQIKNFTGNSCVDLSGYLQLGELISFMDSFSGFITNDSGPMHIAAALGKPQIAIFGATHTKLGFKPLNEKAIVLEMELNCRPCSLHGSRECPRGHFKCMKSITPDILFKNFKIMFDRWIVAN